ncbi:hypothetical protein FOZ63_023396, partial [Perkinsus olseni]
MSRSSIGDLGNVGDADDMVPRPQVDYAFMAGEDDAVVDDAQPRDQHQAAEGVAAGQVGDAAAQAPGAAPLDAAAAEGGAPQVVGAAEGVVAERDNSDKALQLERFSGSKTGI